VNFPGIAAAGGDFSAKNGNWATNYFWANPYGGLQQAAIPPYNYINTVRVLNRN
jgi:hypothetical protein